MVAVLRQAWTGEPFPFRGRTVRVTPTPAQPGGPRLLLGGSSEAAARRAARIGDGFIPSEPEWWGYYRDECLRLGQPDPGPSTMGEARTVVLAEDPEAAWEVLGPYFLYETNAYGAWRVAAQVASPFTPMADVEEVRASGRYRILLPEEYAAEIEAAGDLGMAQLHPMVGGIPPDLAWEHLRLFERACL